MDHLHFKNFTNIGFGWFCVSCSPASPDVTVENVPSRLFLEGESEKTFQMARRGRAVWKSKEDGILSCPDCGQSEVGENHED
jgi:hypothetical protein